MLTRWNSAKLAQRHEGADKDSSPLCADHFPDRGRGEFARLEKLRELLGCHEAKSREKSDDVYREGHVERVTPAPIEEVVHGQVGEKEREQGTCEPEADGRSELRDHRIPALAVTGGFDRQKRSEAVPRAAQREPLPYTESGEQPDRGHPDAVIGRQERDRHRRATEQEQGDRQFHASPMPVGRSP